MRQLTYTLGCLAIALYFLVGVGGGQVLDCCPDLDGNVTTVSTEPYGGCLEISCHLSSALPAHCPECVNHDNRVRRSMSGISKGQPQRSPVQKHWASQKYRMVASLAIESQSTPYLKRAFQDPFLLSIRTVILLN